MGRPNFGLAETRIVTHTLPKPLFDLLEKETARVMRSRSFTLCAILAAYFKVDLAEVMKKEKLG